MGVYTKNRRIQSGSTGAVLPSGDSAVRPDAPEDGLIRYNTDSNAVEYFDGVQFITVGTSFYSNANVAAYLPEYSGNIGNVLGYAGYFFANVFQGNTSDVILAQAVTANVGNIRIDSATPNGVFFANVNSYAVTDNNLIWDGTQLLVVGNVVGSNLVTGGDVFATGNIYGGNLTVYPGLVYAGAGYFTGNVDVLGNLNATIGVVYANSGIFYGDAVTGNNAAFAGVPGFTQLGSNVVMQFAGNVNSYSQLNFENINSGTRASTDIILTADNGNDSTYFADFGMASSNHYDPDFFGDSGSNNDAYLYVVASDSTGPAGGAAGNLILGSTNGVIKLFVGNTAQANVIATVQSDGLYVTGVANITGNITGGNLSVTNLEINGNILSNLNVSGDITANSVSTVNNINVGTNIDAGGYAQIIGNISGGNISTTGEISAVGNISGGNLSATNLELSGNVLGNLSVSGNVTANAVKTVNNLDVGTNIDAGGYAQIIGNISGGNISTTGEILAVGNITGGNLNTLGNAVVGGIKTDNYYYANGQPIDFQPAAGGNTQIQYNNNGDFGANSYFTFDSANLLLDVGSAVDGAITTGNLSANLANLVSLTVQTTATVGNLDSLGTVNAQGNVNAQTNVIVQGNVSAANAVIGNTQILGSGNVILGNVNINGLAQPVANDDAATKFYVDTGISNTVALLGNIEFANTTMTTDGSLANITITPTIAADGLLIINAVTGMVIPTGNTAQRPANVVVGTMRFNSATEITEIYDGNGWVSVGSTFGTITSQQLDGNGVANTFTLAQTATANSIIVINNGVVQQPGTAYSVAGNVITFAEPPAVADTISVRFVSPVITVNEITNDAGTNAIAVDESGVGNLSTTQSVQLPSYNVSQATGLANTAPGQIIYVTNGDSGNPCLAVFSAGAWKRVSLGANIST